MNEADLIARMQGIATHPAARGLTDDAAVLVFGDAELVVTHDMMVAGVHWLADADPADVAWKLVAANLSDLAAKGADPLGVLLGFQLGDDAWDRRFVDGLRTALAEFNVALLGGDTVGQAGNPAGRVIGMTALGRARHSPVPARSGGRVGDILYITGEIGDAGAGLFLRQAGRSDFPALCAAHDRPMPRLADGQALAPLVSAMMDVSDGLLIDTARLAKASGCAALIAIDTVPLSADYREFRGDTVAARLAAATAGDDYQLLFALPDGTVPPVPATPIGRLVALAADAAPLVLSWGGLPLALPDRLGFSHIGSGQG